jgi:glutamate--cysteine ligase
MLKPELHRSLDALSGALPSPGLGWIRRGVEKESLRIDRCGSLVSTTHPSSLGSPLTHRLITTDFAESQMEFITPAGTDARKTLGIMTDIHRHVYRNLGDELLWPASMPCPVTHEDDILLAAYGDSNTGRLKTLYRQGLKHRYGAMMQVIAGVHYNFSMPDSFWPVLQEIHGDCGPLQDFISRRYFGLIRNFLRFGWLIPYLFGASPAIDTSFLRHTGSTLPLKPLGRSSAYLPHATSLRMSDLGYSTREQDNLSISYNSLGAFVEGLRQATRQPNATFARIGVKENGSYRQLNANTLQEESELYAPIRPKRVTGSGEKLSDGLESYGVQYIEVRSLDINPYAPAGMDLEQIFFLDTFLVYCLLSDSPMLSPAEQQVARKNQQRVATDGRNSSLELQDGDTRKTLTEWAGQLFSEMAGVACLLDITGGERQYLSALDQQYEKVLDPSLTPSARMVSDLTDRQLDFSEFALELARQHKASLVGSAFTEVQADEFENETEISLKKQREIESRETDDFDTFLRGRAHEARNRLAKRKRLKQRQDRCRTKRHRDGSRRSRCCISC